MAAYTRYKFGPNVSGNSGGTGVNQKPKPGNGGGENVGQNAHPKYTHLQTLHARLLKRLNAGHKLSLQQHLTLYALRHNSVLPKRAETFGPRKGPKQGPREKHPNQPPRF